MANITRWDPFNELASLQNRFNQLLRTPFGGLGTGEQPIAFGNFVPAVDIYEDEQNITVQAEVPGANEKDLDVRLERKKETEKKEEKFHRIERSYGRFVRSFALPGTVDAEHVNAQFENGLLTITIPTREETKPKQIRIGTGKTTETTRREKEKAA